MSDLRDLARQIDALAQTHPAYSQAHPIVQHACSMLQLMAGYQEGILAVAAFTTAALKMDAASLAKRKPPPRS